MADILTIDVQDQALLAALRPAVDQLEDPTGLLEAVGAVLERNTQLRFETKTDPSGAPWPDLAESTKKAYKYKYRGNTPGSLLERTRHGRDSLDYEVVNRVLEFGFGEAYMGVHETGKKDGTLPKRASLLADWRTGELGAGDRDDVLQEIESYVADLLG